MTPSKAKGSFPSPTAWKILRLGLRVGAQLRLGLPGSLSSPGAAAGTHRGVTWGCLPCSPRAAALLPASCYCWLILARRVGSWRDSRSLPAGRDLLLQPPEKGEELPVPGRTVPTELNWC